MASVPFLTIKIPENMTTFMNWHKKFIYNIYPILKDSITLIEANTLALSDYYSQASIYILYYKSIPKLGPLSSPDFSG